MVAAVPPPPRPLTPTEPFVDTLADMEEEDNDWVQIDGADLTATRVDDGGEIRRWGAR